MLAIYILELMIYVHGSLSCNGSCLCCQLSVKILIPSGGTRNIRVECVSECAEP
jgi:hypothetical protein